MRKVEFNGSIYTRRYGGGGYFRREANKWADRTLLHRDVWEFHYGKIPPKYQIHHRDGDKTNNAISNLASHDPYPVYVPGKVFVPLGEIANGARLLNRDEVSECARLSSMGQSTQGDTAVEDISAEKLISGLTGLSYIVMSGNSTTVKSPLSIRSITEMVTRQTMPSAISKSSQPQNMASAMRESAQRKTAAYWRNAPGLPRSSGTNPKPDESGIPGWLGKFGRAAKESLSVIAQVAVSPFILFIPSTIPRVGYDTVLGAVSAPSRVGKEDITSARSALSAALSSRKASIQAGRKHAPVYVVRSFESGAAPVYNLHVEDCHEFVANGVLVHNCVFALTELFPGMVRKIRRDVVVHTAKDFNVYDW